MMSRDTHSTEPVITKNFGAQEPQHELTTEESPQKVRDLRWCLAIVVRQAVKHEVREEKTDNSQWPDNEDNPPRRHAVRSGSVEMVTPVPKGGDPDLLRTLDNTGTHCPDFCRRAL